MENERHGNNMHETLAILLALIPVPVAMVVFSGNILNIKSIRVPK